MKRWMNDYWSEQKVGELWGHHPCIVFLMAQTSLDRVQDARDFLLIAKEKMSFYNEEFYCYQPNQVIARMGKYDITSRLVGCA